MNDTLNRIKTTVVIISLLPFLACIVPTGEIGEFSFIQPLSDTIAPYGTITIALTEPVDDSSEVHFHFAPPFYSYITSVNSNRDTFTIILSEPLDGNTRYAIRLNEKIYSVTGNSITPKSDSVVLFTMLTEREPNSDTAIADSLEVRLFGTIAMVDDKDIFIVNDASAAAIYLVSYGSLTTFALHSTGKDSVLPNAFLTNNTVSIPKKFPRPFYVTVSAWYKSIGGYYEIGVVKNRK